MRPGNAIVERLDEALLRAGATVLLVLADSARDPDLAPFVGPVHLSDCFLLAARGRAPKLAYLSPMDRDEARATGLELMTPESLQVSDLRSAGIAGAALTAEVVGRALEPTGMPGILALAGRPPVETSLLVLRAVEGKGWRLVPGNGVVRRLRKRKDRRQIGEIRRSVAATLAAFRRVAGVLAAAGEKGGELWLGAERLRVARLRTEVATVLAARGVEQPAGNIMAVGADAAVPHTQGDSGRVLRSGEPIVVDLFPRGELFADCSRSFCVGSPPTGFARAHRAVRGALAAAAEQVTTGVRGWDLQEATCRRLATAGYPTLLSDPRTQRGYVHNLGHGVGYEVHEHPSFAREAGEEGVLEPGDVFTLEPGLYDPEQAYGVRLEDLYLLTAEGAENLTPLPYSFEPRAWG